MYTTLDRENILKAFCRAIGEIEQVGALLQVGSGAKGYLDKYSDLDLVLVVKDGTSLEWIREKLIDEINLKYGPSQIKTYRHHEEVMVICVFLDHYLELDLGIWTHKILKATKADFLVHFDNFGDLEEKMAFVDQQVDLNQVIDEQLSSLWQFVNNTFVAIKRDKLILAISELQVIKDRLIELICLKEGIKRDFYKAFDLIDSENVRKMKVLYTSELDHHKLMFQLKQLIKLTFEVILELGYKKNEQMVFIETFISEEMEN